MSQFTITPSVDQVQEFIEIANDFANPLDLVREAISNSFDAKAKNIKILFDVIKQYGESVLQITIEDDGLGMNRDGLQAFFDLGNSLRRDDPKSIGEKGHGTKVYFNSSEIQVTTTSGGQTWTAVMKEPYRKLFDRQIPTVDVTEEGTPNNQTGTRIIIVGYNNNRRELFTHEILKDHIMWFTKFGSMEKEFGANDHQHVKLQLKGLNMDGPQAFEFGHFFPHESKGISILFNELLVDAPKYYCKKRIKHGQLKNYPEIKYQAIFSIEGNTVKQNYNVMLRRQGYNAPDGAYTVQDRYGVWLCRDFIPVQRANDWIGTRGTEYTRFHAFFNCQEFRLTANRGSVNNTPAEILKDIEREIKSIYNRISESSDWKDMDWLESQVEAYRTTEKEKKDFQFRKRKLNQSNTASFHGNKLAEPNHESGVYGLIIKLSTIKPDFFPFEIIDYNTHTGIDVIVKPDHTAPIHQSKLYYVELKYILSYDLNHSFENIHSIVCWDTKVKHGDSIIDINNERRSMQILAPAADGDYTKYFLDNPAKPHKIEVYVLKDFLKERYKIEFRPRTDKTTV
jgi:hypothetical protein